MKIRFLKHNCKRNQVQEYFYSTGKIEESSIKIGKKKKKTCVGHLKK